MRILRALSLFGVIASLALTPVLASGFNYTYFGGGYFNYSPSGGMSESGPFIFSGSGGFIDGSYNFQSQNKYLSHMNILGGYSHISYGGGVTGNDYDIGLGGHFGIRSVHHLDVLFRVLYLQRDAFSGSSNNGFGLALAGGVRWRPIRRFEFDGLLERAAYGCTGCGAVDTLSAQGQYYFTPHFTGLLGFTFGDNSYGNLFRIGIRYYF